MSSRWWLGAVAFLLACEVATVPVTFTPGPDDWQFGGVDTGLPTVAPYQTAAPTVRPSPEPTPSQEVTEWDCDSINGWILSPHCGLDPWFVAVNPNSDLNLAISDPVRVRVELPGGNVTYRDVYYPAPPTRYNWYFDTAGYDGVSIIAGMPPIVSHSGAGFDLNITSLAGYAALRLEATELFTPPGRYVVGFELTPNVTLPDASRGNPALLRKQCRISTDTGNKYTLTVQNAGHNQYQPVLDSAVYVIAIEQPLMIVLECGIYIEQPIFNGTVTFERFFIEAVEQGYGDVVTRIE